MRKDTLSMTSNIFIYEEHLRTGSWNQQYRMVCNPRKHNENNECQKLILGAGSRIIPMDAAVLGDFAKGNTISQTKDRTQYRGVRRLRERCLLRRERLFRVLDIMGFLPQHFSNALTRYGKFKDADEEPKIAWRKDDEGKCTFSLLIHSMK